MKSFKHWMVCLDLTNMDHLILGYLDFLSEIYQPDKITFVHVVEDSRAIDELSEMFPEIKAHKSLESIIRDDLQESIKEHFEDVSLRMNIIIRDGDTAETILSALSEFNPDLLVLGKKKGYEGQGVLARKVTKYAQCSLLYVAENSQYRLQNIHLPVSFTQASARAIRFAKAVAKEVGAQLHLQHVFSYPRQFFPYIPTEQYSEKLDELLQKKYAKFRKKYDLQDLPDCTFTVDEDKKSADQIYNLTLRTRADLLVVGAKNKSSAAALLIDEPADNLAEYQFGIPVLVYKEKEEHTGLLKSLLNKE